MKILVLISKVPDTTSKIIFDGETKLNETGIQYIINPYDEWYALVRALEFKESLGAGEVVILTVGDASLDPVMRKAFAIGGDRGVRINMETADAMNIAFQISEYAKAEKFDVIMGGKETINYNGGIVMGMIAEYLSQPYFSNVTKLDFKDNSFVGEVDIQGGVEVIKASGPLVVSCAKGVAEQRSASMKGIMAAKSKKLDVIEPKSFQDNIVYEHYEVLPPRSKSKIAKTTEELFEMLKNEARVI